MNKNKFQKGFTLIELLVVIAIIGILASVLLVNLSSTRNRAKDATIKLEMSQIRTAVENFSLTNNTYVGSCFFGTDCAALQADIVSKGGSNVVQNFSASKYCVQYQLNTGGGTWCVDSTGYSSGTDISCDATNLNCVSP